MSFMISRNYLSCRSCDKLIIARIQVGYEATQPHTFPCPHCDSIINIKLDLSQPPRTLLEHDDTCEIVDHNGSEENGIIMNLGVGFTIPADMVHADMYSPAMAFMRDLQRIKGAAPTSISQSRSVFQIEGFPGSAGAWKHLEKACLFHRKKNLNLREKHLEGYYEATSFPRLDFKDTVINFVRAFVGARARQGLEGLIEWKEELQKKFDGEMKRYSSYHNNDVAKERFKEYLDVISTYFAAHHEYEQTITYARFNSPIVVGTIATSANFELTKMFYGSAFEMYGDHFDLLAALNNISHDRPYDQLLNISLAKYRQTDKSKRPDCLKGTGGLDFFYEEYDSSLRNASHHRWIRISDDRRTIEYRNGGSGEKRVLSYAEYTFRCNKLFIQLLVLFAFEIEFFGLLG